MRYVGALLVLMPLLFHLSGCTQGLNTSRYQSRVIPAASVDEVFLAAQVLLRREFGPLKIEADAHRAVSRPAEYSTASESGTARDLYGGRSTMRRIAHFSVARRGDDVVARLRVDIERQDTARREVFQPDRHRLSDAPGQTAIERDAATSAQQNTVWTFVKRDRRLERALLAELQGRFAPQPPEVRTVPPADEGAPAEAP
jgi:hypothetical protein